MKGAQYAEVIAALPHLTPEERGKISERLKALDSLTGVRRMPRPRQQAAPGSTAVDEILEAVIEIILKETGERVSLFALRKAVDGAALREKACALMEFLSIHAPTKAQRLGLLRVGFELLHHDLARSMTVTSRTLVSCCHQIPAALDRGFPGYAASGLLGMVVGNGIEKEDDH